MLGSVPIDFCASLPIGWRRSVPSDFYEWLPQPIRILNDRGEGSLATCATILSLSIAMAHLRLIENSLFSQYDTHIDHYQQQFCENRKVIEYTILGTKNRIKMNKYLTYIHGFTEQFIFINILCFRVQNG